VSGHGDLRRRAWLCVTAALVVTAGLATRIDPLPLPAFLKLYAGDTLWAVLVFLLLAIAAPRRSALCLAVPALAIAYGVEILQLYQAPWLNAIRSTLPGRLILGQGFLFSDLICYTAGICLAAAIYQRTRA
jgi:hypothetical protein